MEKNNLYITYLHADGSSVHYLNPELPSKDVKNDINELLEDKYTTKVNMEFTYVDSTGDEHLGSVIVNEIDDYEGPYMEDDSFYEETQLTDENLIDLIEFD